MGSVLIFITFYAMQFDFGHSTPPDLSEFEVYYKDEIMLKAFSNVQ